MLAASFPWKKYSRRPQWQQSSVNLLSTRTGFPSWVVPDFASHRSKPHDLTLCERHTAEFRLLALRMEPMVLLILVGFAALIPQASAGCFWDSRCQNLWMGGCGDGFVAVETSSDCQGLCSAPQYGTCPLFFARFQCCREDKARLSKTCSRCPSRKDVGNEWICCSDCSEPSITDVKIKTGYCQTDAHLAFQPKPREAYKWTAREWTSCSGRCKKASRTREVRCLLYLENVPYSPTVVADDKCPASTKPPSKEGCTPPSCMDASHQKHHGLPIWAIVLISLTCFAAAGGLAFAGFIIYRRRSDNSNHGFVYVMLDSY